MKLLIKVKILIFLFCFGPSEIAFADKKHLVQLRTGRKKIKMINVHVTSCKREIFFNIDHNAIKDIHLTITNSNEEEIVSQKLHKSSYNIEHLEEDEYFIVLHLEDHKLIGSFEKE